MWKALLDIWVQNTFETLHSPKIFYLSQRLLEARVLRLKHSRIAQPPEEVFDIPKESITKRSERDKKKERERETERERENTTWLRNLDKRILTGKNVCRRGNQLNDLATQKALRKWPENIISVVRSILRQISLEICCVLSRTYFWSNEIHQLGILENEWLTILVFQKVQEYILQAVVYWKTWI